MLRLTSTALVVALLAVLCACTSTDDDPLPATAPVVSALTVSTGPAAGGNQVTLTGVGFLEASPLIVRFGDNDATAVTIISNTEARATAPAGTPGATVNITVINGNGSSTFENAYTYSALNLTTIDTAVGGSAGGTMVTLTGSGFDLGMTTVTFGVNPATMVSVTDATTLTCLSPPGSSGTTVDVSVTNDGGTATLASAFSYDPFLVNTIMPTSGSGVGGTTVTVSGVGFMAAPPTVTFGANDGTNVVVVDDTTLTVETPAGPAGTAVDVTVTSAGGTAKLTAGFTYDPFLVFSVTNSNGPAAGGNNVTLSGVGFSFGAATVMFGPNPAANVTVLGDGTLTCDVPPGVENTMVNVSVSNMLGTATLVNGYTYDDFGLDTIMPANGPIAGGELITLAGTGFATGGGVTITIGGIAATNITIVNDTTLTALLPAGVMGQVADVVVSSGNGMLTLPGAFTFDMINVTGIDVPMGPAAGGNQVTLVGSNLDMGAVTVMFGANPANNVMVVSNDGITCEVPPGVMGTTVDVWVMNSNGSAVLRMSYTYQ